MHGSLENFFFPHQENYYFLLRVENTTVHALNNTLRYTSGKAAGFVRIFPALMRVFWDGWCTTKGNKPPPTAGFSCT